MSASVEAYPPKFDCCGVDALPHNNTLGYESAKPCRGVIEA